MRIQDLCQWTAKRPRVLATSWAARLTAPGRAGVPEVRQNMQRCTAAITEMVLVWNTFV
jgi:hypothetical protein